MSHFDLNLFRVFDAIYAQGNLTRAGEVLHITQPAVSNALARLRELFGDPLFVRAAGGVQPTPKAHGMAAEVRKALQALNNTVDRARDFEPARAERRYSFLMSDLLEAVLMPRLVAPLGGAAPRITLDVYQAARGQIARELGTGQADFALDAVPLTDARLASARLIEDEYVCTARPDHPVVANGLTLEDYLAAGHIHASTRRRGLGHVDLALRRQGLQRRITYRTQHYLQAPFALAGSDLLLTIPRSLAGLFDLTMMELPFPVPPLEIYLYWHRASENDPALSWMRAQILGEFDADGRVDAK